LLSLSPPGDKARMGGTMRLGARTTLLQPHSLVHRLYAEHLGAGGREAEEGGGGGGGVLEVDERHRHRYEVNPDVVSDLEAAGLRFVGKDRTGQRMEILELGETTEERRNGRQGHPFFAAVQFHPEFKSRPTAPSPLFLGLLRAASRERERRARGEKGSQGAKERVAPSMDEG
jgi:CTP synthase